MPCFSVNFVVCKFSLHKCSDGEIILAGLEFVEVGQAMARLMLLALAMQIETLEVNQHNPPLRLHLRTIKLLPGSISQPSTNKDWKILDFEDISLKQGTKASSSAVPARIATNLK